MIDFKFYVLGFLFSNDLESVVLILKKKPEWQAGLLNGVGGKIEPDETSEQAMRREFLEETGKDIHEANWRRFCNIRGSEYHIDCYMAIGDVSQVRTTTSEYVVICNTKDIHQLNVVTNLNWLIPLALDQGITSCSARNDYPYTKYPAKQAV